MDRFPTFTEFLTSQSVQIPVFGFIFNIVLAVVLSCLLSHIYVRYGNTLSNRKSFASNFILLTMTTVLIISVVKSSLALSLGLVGALSIIRFRAAIKEPEELSYLFLCIAIGLGLGADQTLITIIAIVVIMLIIISKNKFNRNTEEFDYHFIVSGQKQNGAELDDIMKVLKVHSKGVNLRRVNDSKDKLEASFIIEFKDYLQFKSAMDEIKAINENLKITFMDQKGIF